MSRGSGFGKDTSRKLHKSQDGSAGRGNEKVTASVIDYATYHRSAEGDSTQALNASMRQMHIGEGGQQIIPDARHVESTPHDSGNTLQVVQYDRPNDRASYISGYKEYPEGSSSHRKSILERLVGKRGSDNVQNVDSPVSADQFWSSQVKFDVAVRSLDRYFSQPGMMENKVYFDYLKNIYEYMYECRECLSFIKREMDSSDKKLGRKADIKAQREKLDAEFNRMTGDFNKRVSPYAQDLSVRVDELFRDFDTYRSKLGHFESVAKFSGDQYREFIHVSEGVKERYERYVTLSEGVRWIAASASEHSEVARRYFRGLQDAGGTILRLDNLTKRVKDQFDQKNDIDVYDELDHETVISYSSGDSADGFPDDDVVLKTSNVEPEGITRIGGSSRVLVDRVYTDSIESFTRKQSDIMSILSRQSFTLHDANRVFDIYSSIAPGNDHSLSEVKQQIVSSIHQRFNSRYLTSVFQQHVQLSTAVAHLGSMSHQRFLFTVNSLDQQLCGLVPESLSSVLEEFNALRDVWGNSACKEVFSIVKGNPDFKLLDDAMSDGSILQSHGRLRQTFYSTISVKCQVWHDDLMGMSVYSFQVERFLKQNSKSINDYQMYYRQYYDSHSLIHDFDSSYKCIIPLELIQDEYVESLDIQSFEYQEARSCIQKLRALENLISDSEQQLLDSQRCIVEDAKSTIIDYIDKNDKLISGIQKHISDLKEVIDPMDNMRGYHDWEVIRNSSQHESLSNFDIEEVKEDREELNGQLQLLKSYMATDVFKSMTNDAHHDTFVLKCVEVQSRLENMVSQIDVMIVKHMRYRTGIY